MEGSGHELTFDRDYREVCRSLRNLHRRGDLIALGIALGLSYQTVQGMGNGDDFLSQVIAAWLKQQDNVLGQSGEPTWKVLADKLEEVGCTEIAADVQRIDKHPQHKGESEQQDENLPTLSSDSSDSLMDNQLSHSILNEQSYVSICSDQTAAPISTQSMTQPEQDQSQTITSGTCLEQPPAPKRTKLDQQCMRERSDDQQLSCATSTEELKPLVTHGYTVGQMFSPVVTMPTMIARSSHAQTTENDSLQNTVTAQASNSSLALPPTCTVSTSLHPATSVLVAVGSQSHPKALPTTGDSSPLIKAEEAGEAFRVCRADLLEAIVDPLILANHLYSKKIISRETLKEIMDLPLTVSNKNVILLDAVEVRIRTHPSDFLILLAVLESDAHLCVYAEGLRSSYSLMCVQSSNVQPINSSATMQLNTYLMNYYKCSQRHSPFDIKFPHLLEKTFISLAIIEKTSITRASADIFTKGTLHGHADEILKKKKPIELEAVLEPPEGQQSMKCVFVEGAPGVGKSTFALELCKRQERSKIYSLVVLLRLREKRIHEIQNVADLFYHKPDLQQAVTKEIIACEGKNVLFVLDGFDELPVKLQNSSFIVELIQGKHLPACTVVVTSRPSATANLLFCCKSQINKRIEVLGFTHEHIKQYAESMLYDEPNVLKDFLRYISNNPAIHGMMYIPLNSAIVLAIYKDSRTIHKPVPHTLTQLYTELCLSLLRKYLTEKCDPLVEQIHNTEAFENLPDTLKDQLIRLGNLAFEGAKRKEITFKQLPDGCDGLGFMNISTEFYLGRKSIVSYSFLHLTLQEFLAAFYISQLPATEQKLLYIENNSLLYPQEMVTVELRLTDLCKMFAHKLLGCDLNVMWRFMAGLTGFRDIGWELVHKAIQRPLSKSQSHVCFPPLLIQSLFEVHDVQTLESICDTIVRNVQLVNKYLLCQQNDFSFIAVNALSLFDCYAMGYCIAASKHEWSVDLSGIGGDEVVKMFCCGLQCVGDVGGYFSVLDLSSNSLTNQAMTYLNEISPKVLNKVEALELSDNQLDSTALDSLSDAILNMNDLTMLSVANNSVGNGEMIKLLGIVTNIHQFNLIEINLGSSDVAALSQLMKQSANLKELQIGDKDMSVECVALLVETILQSPASLEDIELWWVQFTVENASKFKLLENNNNLNSLKFINCSVGLDLTIPYVAKALHKNESLKVLGIPYKAPKEQTLKSLLTKRGEPDASVDIGKSSMRALSEMLKVNKALKCLVIYTKNLNDDDAQTLIYALQVNSTLENLVFHHEVKLVGKRLCFL